MSSFFSVLRRCVPGGAGFALRRPMALFRLWTSRGSTLSRRMSADRVFCQVFLGLPTGAFSSTHQPSSSRVCHQTILVYPEHCSQAMPVSYSPGTVCMAHLYHPYNLLFERYLLSPDTSKKIRMHGPPVGLYRTYNSIGAS